MVSRIVARTRLDSVKPLGEPGQRTYEFVAGNVRRMLGEQHASLFAEPSNQSGFAVWRSELPGEILPLKSLDPDTATTLKSLLGKRVADIYAVADEFAVKADPAAQSIAIALRNAVEIPGEDCIFSVGGEPVIVQWAYHLDVYAPPKALLSRLVPSTQTVVDQNSEVPPEPHPAVVTTLVAPVPTEKRSGIRSLLWWLGWLLLAIMMIIILLKAIPACGLWPISYFGNCESAALAARDVNEEAAAIQAEINNLERAILDREQRCVMQEPKAGEPKAGEPKAGEPKASDKDVGDAITEGDTSLLAGCWKLDSDFTLYIDNDIKRPRKVQDWQVCLDSEGSKGTQRITFDDGAVCHGTLTSTVERGDNMTWIDDDIMRCNDSSWIVKRKSVCRPTVGGTITCGTFDAEIKNAKPIDVKLRRE